MKRVITHLSMLGCLLLFTNSNLLLANTVEPAPAENSAAISVSIVSLAHVSCFGLTNGTVTVLASGGVAYAWSNGIVGPVLVGLSAGVYTVTATDLLGATAQLAVTINQPLELDLT